MSEELRFPIAELPLQEVPGAVRLRAQNTNIIYLPVMSIRLPLCPLVVASTLREITAVLCKLATSAVGEYDVMLVSASSLQAGSDR